MNSGFKHNIKITQKCDLRGRKNYAKRSAAINFMAIYATKLEELLLVALVKLCCCTVIRLLFFMLGSYGSMEGSVKLMNMLNM